MIYYVILRCGKPQKSHAAPGTVWLLKQRAMAAPSLRRGMGVHTTNIYFFMGKKFTADSLARLISQDQYCHLTSPISSTLLTRSPRF